MLVIAINTASTEAHARTVRNDDLKPRVASRAPARPRTG